jgi:phosphatidylglycerophosphate synthase
MILAADHKLFSPSMYGKATTAAQVATVLLTLIALLVPSEILHWIQQGGIFSTAALTVISGLQYAWHTAEGLRGAEPAIEERRSPAQDEPHLERSHPESPVGQNRLH